MEHKLPDSISIIVLFYNGKHYLKMCLESIINTIRERDEIIVFINNSDKEVHNIDYYRDRVKYVNVYESLGYSSAANKAIEYASNEYVVFCDQDIVFYQDWLINLWMSYSSGKDIGIAGIKLVNHTDNTILDFGIASSKYNFIHPGLGLDINHPLVRKDREVQMVCSAVFIISKNDYAKIGGFYEPFGTLYSDLDFCLRAKDVGLKVIVSANSMAYHFHGEYYEFARDYKNHFLKADVKGVFMRKNSDRIVDDANIFIRTSFDYFKSIGKPISNRYVFCNIMSIANYHYYEDEIYALGIDYYDKYDCKTGHRDISHIDLFSLLGNNIMDLGVDIVYFVDRFTSLKNNDFWWARRKSKNDFIIDRHANICHVSEIL